MLDLYLSTLISSEIGEKMFPLQGLCKTGCESEGQGKGLSCHSLLLFKEHPLRLILPDGWRTLEAWILVSKMLRDAGHVFCPGLRRPALDHEPPYGRQRSQDCPEFSAQNGAGQTGHLVFIPGCVLV